MQAPSNLTVTWPRPPIDGKYPYFDALKARADCAYAYALRSQAEIDALPKGAVNPKKLPILYDPVQDAAMFSAYAPTSTDIQQRSMATRITGAQWLITWDFRLDENWQWKEPGNLVRQKAWRFDPVWWSWKLDFQNAALHGEFCEFIVTTNSQKWLGPGTTRGDREQLFPKLSPFYLKPNTWTRTWALVDGIDKQTTAVISGVETPICALSVWCADETRDPVQMYDRVAMVVNTDPAAQFRIEFDTSADTATNPIEMHGWQRNVIVLAPSTVLDLSALLERFK